MSLVAHEVGAIVARTDLITEKNYCDLLRTHEFATVAMESSGVFGPRSLHFVNSLAHQTPREGIWITC